MFALTDYHYDLPADRIAQHPAPDRTQARLLHLNRKTDRVSHHHFSDIPGLLRPGDLLVVNDTRVVPARLLGRKETGGRVEVMIIDYAGGRAHLETSGWFQCECLIKASKRPREGARLLLGSGLEAVVVSHSGPVSMVRFICKQDFETILHTHGRLPLPPYIRRDEPEKTDLADYQTVYAEKDGAVAAPTAGLHFTGPLLADLKNTGIHLAALTLHVGYGTFVPVKVKDIRQHEIHREFFSLPASLADAVNRARAEGRRVIAVGTTVVRTLEYSADRSGTVVPGRGMCDLFIYPGFEFRVVDAMITNFHLPESTLLMLVSAFHNREAVLRVYREAVEKNYRFFSYGDAMFIE